VIGTYTADQPLQVICSEFVQSRTYQLQELQLHQAVLDLSKWEWQQVLLHLAESAFAE
jgi:hypothetical protein